MLYIYKSLKFMLILNFMYGTHSQNLLAFKDELARI